MCGIAGIFNLSDSGNTSLDMIKKMTDVLQHRGPDESGIYIDDQVALGHARLSIIDLSGGTQPIHNADSSLWIVYNGEVFNYPELKQDLIKKGYSFYTNTDTEVILNLYEDLGPSCLEHLNGQFAFAIWDSKKQELFLARDRVGIRPLFYTIQNNSLRFASEIKSIFMDPKIPRRFDHRAINQIFTFWTTLPGTTVFKDIFELPPGHFLKISKNQKTVRKYWDIPFYPPDEQLDWSAGRICEQVQDLLKDAVRIRLRADVPVGCYLSGGLDSSGLAALIVNNFNNNVNTFGIRFEEDEFDEGDFQQKMVSHLKTKHTDLIATNKKIADSFADVVWFCEKPILRTAPVPLFLLSGAVNHSGFKVVMTGEGADEIFGGYNIFKEAKIRNFWAKQPDSKFRGSLIGKLYPYIFKNPRLKKMQQQFFASGLDKTNHPFFSHHIRWQNSSKIAGFLLADIREKSDSKKDYDELTGTLPHSFDRWDYLAKAQYLEISLFLSNYLLSSQGDRMAMGHSVEIRLPYLDYRLIEFMARVPAIWKLRGLNEKYILKQAFKELLPEQIVNRPKHPYRAPIVNSLLNEDASGCNKQFLSESAIKNAGLFDPVSVKKLLDKIQRVESPGEIDNMAVAGILSSQIIYDQFISEFKPDSNHQSAPDVLVDRRTKNGV